MLLGLVRSPSILAALRAANLFLDAFDFQNL